MSNGTITIHLDQPLHFISPNLYGHFIEHLGACINEGVWVGRDSAIPNQEGFRLDILEAMKQIRPAVLRWPGGCFADDYHWVDGIGPTEQRPRRINLFWGHNIETNQFGTHEFIRLCELVGARPYLAGNVGSGSVRELRDWIEYCNCPADSSLARLRHLNGSPEPFHVRFWGVGNEAWGCGGHFEPEDYAAEFRRFATYMPDFTGSPLCLIACGPDGNNLDWTRRFFTKLGKYPRIHALAAHYYCGTAGTATEYTSAQWRELLQKALAMETLIRQQRALMDTFDPARKIGLIVDEWGTWHPPTPGRNPLHLWQQNTLRDAMVAAITLDIFNRNADKIVMANIAQLSNVLQALFLTHADQMLTTPTYHVFDMYKSHQAGNAVNTTITLEPIHDNLPAMAGSASIKGGVLTLTLTNLHHDRPLEMEMNFQGGSFSHLDVTELTHSDIHAHNTFEAPDTVRPRAENLPVSGTALAHVFPPASVTAFRFVTTIPREIG